MAKKNKGTFSYLETQEALESMQNTMTKDSIGLDLLRVFCGYGDATINRIIDGKGNDAKDGKTILIKKLLAYRPVESSICDDKNPYGILDEIMSDNYIAKKEPRLYVASDGHRIIGYDPKENDIYDNEISLLWKDFEFFKPLAGIEKFRNVEEAEADVKSAEMMAKIYDDIRRYNDITDEETIKNINIFMTRLLFCFFAEDTGLFQKRGMFTAAIQEDTKSDGSDLAAFLEGIFDIMAVSDAGVRANLPEIITQFPYVNGGLFEKHIPIPVLSRRTRMLMLKCGEYNWGEINPDIFGSMIQAVVTPENRSGLGMHYTSVPNIMKVIRPLFLDELTETYVKYRDNAKELNKLLVRLSEIKFFDPACGSGNFLIIAYKCVRELEIEIWKRLKELGQSMLPFSNISLSQFYGIELDEYACDTATLSLWLAEHQINNRFYDELGVRAQALPLRKSGNIVCGNACRIDWNSVCPHTPEEEVYIMGNPPYLGSSMQDEGQKSDLAFVCGDLESYKNLDYIASWFILGSKYIQNTRSKCAFVSTNSICQGEQVAMLWKPIFDMGIEISFAHKSFKWSNNAKNKAAVVCVIVGVECESKKRKSLYSGDQHILVDYISPYLIPNVKSIIGRTSAPISNFPDMIMGSKPSDGGNLIFDSEKKDELLRAYPELSDIIKGYMGADDFLNGFQRYCLWMDKDKYTKYQYIAPVASMVEGVKQFRLNAKAESTVEYAQYPYAFRQPQYQETESIIVPSTSSERREYIPIGFLGKDVVVSNSTYVVYDAELWHFAVLTSKMHNVWMRIVCGRMKTDYRYTNTLCYNTFAFPKITIEQKETLQSLAENIILTRENHTEMTLAEMYNPETMPQDLKYAHQALDLAVERCYRPEPFTSDDERLEHLFKLYEKMIKIK